MRVCCSTARTSCVRRCAPGRRYRWSRSRLSKLEADNEEGALARALAGSGTEVVTASDQVLDAMSPVRTPSGIVAIAERAPASAADMCRNAGFVLVAVDVQDPGNLGSLVRTAEAGGASGVLVTGVSAHPFSWKAVRGSMGSVLRCPWRRCRRSTRRSPA